MKKLLLALTFLMAACGVASAQFAPSMETLRGLPGVRVLVMFHAPTRAEAFDNVRRPGLLKMLEDDTKVKLQDAGIPFSKSKYADDIGNAQLIVLIKFDQPNGVDSSVRTEVKLNQRVRLVRDSSIETDAVTWSGHGVGNVSDTPRIQRLVANLVENFIRDYQSQNPKQ